MKKSPTVVGAGIGLVVGAIILVKAYFTLLWCFPYVATLTPDRGPWYCASGFYNLIQALTFPIPVLTNDLANAAYYAPLTLLVYLVAGALIGRFLWRPR